MKRLLRALDRHWFEPARLTDLAAVRWLLVGTELVLLLVPALSNGVGVCPACAFGVQLNHAMYPGWTFFPIPALKVLLLPLGWGVRPDPMLLHAVWWVAVGSGIAGLVGLYTRPSLLVFAAANTLLIAHGYSYIEIHHTESIMVIALWILVLAPSGSRWSVDSLIRRLRDSAVAGRFEPRRPADDLSPMARWPLRLVQWLLVLMYFSAFLAKMHHHGLHWANGYTLSYDLASDGLSRGRPLGIWLAQHLTLDRVLSAGTLLFEGSYALAVLVPALTWPYVLAGWALHGGIWAAQDAPFLQVMVLYCVFLPTLRERWPATLRLGRAETARRPSRTVVYDGDCPLCIRTMTLLDALDLRNRLDFRDLDVNRDAHDVVTGSGGGGNGHALRVTGLDGSAYTGFFALRVLARQLPLLWPVVPLLYVPPAGRVGPWLYRQLMQAGGGGGRACRIHGSVA